VRASFSSAPDLKTDWPEEIDKHTLLHHVGDMVGLLDTIGERQAVIVGHGAPVAWYAARMRPELGPVAAGRR
jgi:pimeloyl-ACP methyl ester carboxylesterase